MKRFIIFAILLTSPALAQSPPTPEDITISYLTETGQLRVALGQAQKQIVELNKEIAKLKEAQFPPKTDDKK